MKQFLLTSRYLHWVGTKDYVFKVGQNISQLI